MADLTDRIRSEANIADRPGQLDRLNQIADDVDDALMAQARLVEAMRDRIEELLVSLRICAEERRELYALREDRADLRVKVEALPDLGHQIGAIVGYRIKGEWLLRDDVLNLLDGASDD